MTVTDQIAPAGHNQPPLSFEDEVRARYAKLFADFETQKGFAERAPEIIDDATARAKGLEDADALCAMIGRVIVNLRALSASASAAHAVEKKPFKDKVDMIDRMFLSRGLIGEIETHMIRLQRRQSAYMTAKDAAVRKRADDEARAQREAARLSEEAAIRAADKGDFEGAATEIGKAQAATVQAGEAAAVLAAKPAERVRTSYAGVTTSAKVDWLIEVDRKELNAKSLKTLLEFIPTDALEKAAKAWHAANQRKAVPDAPPPGIKITEGRKALNR